MGGVESYKMGERQKVVRHELDISCADEIAVMSAKHEQMSVIMKIIKS